MNVTLATSAASAASPSTDDSILDAALKQTSVVVEGCFWEIRNALIDLSEIQAVRDDKDTRTIEVILRGGNHVALSYGSTAELIRDLCAFKIAWVAFKNSQIKPVALSLNGKIYRVEDISNAELHDVKDGNGIKLTTKTGAHDIVYASILQMRRDFEALQKAMGVANP